PGVSLQKARSWDEGVAANFSTTPLKDIFHGKKVDIFGLPIEFYGDFDGSFCKSLDLEIDLSAALLDRRSHSDRGRPLLTMARSRLSMLRKPLQSSRFLALR
ncbi:hypothetical protein EJB05_49311, partial [Eragrostis curvula]